VSGVLHVIDTGGPGGAETVFVTLAAALDRPDSPSAAIVSREGWLAEQVRARGLVPQVLNGQGGFNVAYLRGLVSAIRRKRPVAVIAHLYGAGVYASLAGRMTRTPVIVVLHGHTDVSGGPLAAAKAAVLRAGAQRVVFVSEALREELLPRLGLRRAQSAVIPNGIDLGRFDPHDSPAVKTELGLPSGALLVGAVGNLRPAKGYDILLEAARRLLDEGLDVHFAVAGDPQEPLYGQLLALRSRLGLEGRFTFLGLRSDAPSVLRGLDIFVSSSTTEGFSLACVEAMACGRPVVATRSGGPETILEDGRTGLLVPAADPGALAAAISTLARDGALRHRMGGAARLDAESRFSVRSTIAAYESLVAEVRRP
jgi:glycosyltransferase involved in cell wall biosynthesis